MGFGDGMAVIGRRDVGTGTKRTGGTRDHDGAHTAVFARGGERRGQCDPEFTIDRILATRSVQRQRPHAVAVAAQQHGHLGHQG